MSKRIYIVDLMKIIVQRAELRLLAELQIHDESIHGIHYEYGHPLEIIETLKQMDESGTLRFKKYPLVALFTDVKEKKGATPGVYSNAGLHLIVAHHTMPDYKADERKVKNFMPVIHPIVDEVLCQIDQSKFFLNADPVVLQREETDRYFWGKGGLYGNEGNIFNDYLDATEIEIKDIRVNPDCILKPLSTNI